MQPLRLLALLITAFLVAASGAESVDSKPIPRVLVTPDPIDQLVAKLATQPEWSEGKYIPVKLPESATADQVLQQVFQNLRVADHKVLEVRQVKIPPDVTRAYSAALYQMGGVRKIVLFQFQNGGWWNRIYETDPGPPGAHAVFPGRGEWTEEVQGLSCRITTEKTEYQYGEVVRMLVEIRNTGDKPLTLEPEPRVGISGNDKNSFPQQPAVLDMTFSQGKPGYASNHEITFTRGQQSEARALVVESGKTFSEFVEVTPWGLTLSSIPATPQPGKMSLQTVLQQKLTPDDKVTSLPFKPVEFTVLAKREADKASQPENAEADALRDLQAGTPKCHVVGEPAPHFANWKTILKRDYGIELVPCGCKGESDYVKRYQKTVLPELKKKHGEDFLKISEEKAKAPAVLQPVQPTLQPGDVPIGSLGFAIGNYLTIEGVREDGFLTSGVNTLRVNTVNGTKLKEPVAIWIENVEALPKDARCVLRGYENFQMIGQPPAYAAAAKEAGREAPPQPQAGWQVHYHFVVLSVVSPEDLKLKQDP